MLDSLRFVKYVRSFMDGRVRVRHPALRDAAIAGVGCAVLSRLIAYDALQSGQLQQVLPGWAPRPGLVQVAFATRRGMRPAVRQLVDALAAGFDELIAQDRCLAPPLG